MSCVSCLWVSFISLLSSDLRSSGSNMVCLGFSSKLEIDVFFHLSAPIQSLSLWEALACSTGKWHIAPNVPKVTPIYSHYSDELLVFLPSPPPYKFLIFSSQNLQGQALSGCLKGFFEVLISVEWINEWMKTRFPINVKSETEVTSRVQLSDPMTATEQALLLIDFPGW